MSSDEVKKLILSIGELPEDIILTDNLKKLM